MAPQTKNNVYSIDSANTRNRAPNFTTAEKLCLLEVIGKYRDIIENKKTDKMISDSKNNCWESIQLEFNAQTGGVFRNIQQLRTLYDQIKKNAKKEKSADKVATFLTGGGKKYTEISAVANKAIQIMEPLTTTPLINRFDNSAEYNNEKLNEDESTLLFELTADSCQYIDLQQSIDKPTITDNIVIESEASDTHSPMEISVPSNNLKKQSVIRGVYEGLASICERKKAKMDHCHKYEDELMEMRRARYEMEMTILKEQHNFFINCHRDQEEMMEMKRKRHNVELIILNEQLAHLKKK